jgi:hypothetical protein
LACCTELYREKMSHAAWVSSKSSKIWEEALHYWAFRTVLDVTITKHHQSYG